MCCQGSDLALIATAADQEVVLVDAWQLSAVPYCSGILLQVDQPPPPRVMGYLVSYHMKQSKSYPTYIHNLSLYRLMLQRKKSTMAICYRNNFWVHCVGVRCPYQTFQSLKSATTRKCHRWCHQCHVSHYCIVYVIVT